MSAELETSPGTRERELFLAAMEKTDLAERAAFLDAACGHDATLRRRVEQLLREQAEVGSFLEQPALAGARPIPPVVATAPSGTAVVATTEQAGDRIGRYKLLQKIGEGGCGVVYMAEQEAPVRRRVALKIIKLGMDTKSVIARFEAERQALALMDHPNIAKVFDAGATETGRPYFVMELVRGIKITDYCDQNNLPTEERLKLFIQVCQAIQHAHQKGIIHRDIKPSNTLVTLHDGRPVPKVIDFGIAKATEQRLTDKTLFTEFTAFIGTPAYMSPEQAEMSGLDLDTRSDIYSLGVLLYELLTGKTPFDAQTLLQAGLDECRRTIREQEPVRPSTRLATMLEAELTTTAQQRHTEALKLIHLLRGDLDWVVMKCLEKDRARRYATANDLALDTQRYLEGEPVLARPPSNVYRFQKFVRRHRGAFAAAAGIAATLLAGIALSTWQAVRATKAEHDAHVSQNREAQLRRQAEQEKALARLSEYVAHINLTHQSLLAGNLGRAAQLLDQHRPAAGEPDLRGFEWRYLWQLSQGDEHVAFPTQDGPVHALAYSPDGELLAIGQREKLTIWNIRTRSLVTSLPKGALSLAFLPHGKALVAASHSTVRVWNILDWTEQIALPGCSGPFALSGDGSLLATDGQRPFPPRGGEGGVRIWETATWKEQRVLSGASGPIAFSPDGKTVAIVSEAGITLRSLQDPGQQVVLQGSTNVFSRGGPFRSDRVLAFSPDGQFVVAARNTPSERGVFVISIWDAKSGQEIGILPKDPDHPEHTGFIWSLAFSPDGRTLATASMDHSVRLWDFKTRQRVSTLQGHKSEVWAMAIAPDGQTLISGAKDGGVKLWATHRPQQENVLPGPWEPLALSKDSQTLAALTRQDTVVFFNLSTREPEQEFPLDPPRAPRGPPRFKFGPPGGRTPPVAFSVDLRILAHGQEDGSVKLWNTETRESTTLKAAGGPVDLLALSPDGRSLITGGWGRSLRWWDLSQGTNVVLETEASRVLFSADGRTLATFQRGNTVEIWDVAARSLRTNLVIEPPPGPAVAFSPDGRMLATAATPTDVDNPIRLWDVASGKLLGTCTGHKQAVFSVAFSPDGKTLATASDDSTVKLWNVATQQELLSDRRLGGSLRGLMFSPDGQWLVGASGFFSPAGGLRFYRAPLFSETDK